MSSSSQAFSRCAVCVHRALLLALEEAGVRQVAYWKSKGDGEQELIHQLRQDGDDRWLFLAQAKAPYNRDVPVGQNVRIRVEGAFRPTVYDTLTGTTHPIPHRAENGCA